MQEMFLTAQQTRDLLEQYGSPLYVYSEQILRQRCRDMVGMLPKDNAFVSYSVKANTNLTLLRIAHEEGLHADAMSLGEVELCRIAGFAPEEIFYVCNNVSAAEMKAVADMGIVVSVDAVSQMETFAKACPGGRAAVRVNTEFGDGHSDKVITAGKKTKFGVQLCFMDDVCRAAEKGGVKIVGLNQHIGSAVRDPSHYEAAANVLIDEALKFPELELLDFGGGFAVPYKEGEASLDLDAMHDMFARLRARLVAEHPNGKNISIRIEPGRYVAAECGVLLGTVEAVKVNHEKTYVGTDIGFNDLIRPMLYDAYHTIVFPESKGKVQPVTVTGNICESGDILAKDRELPLAKEGETVAVLTAGAYGFVMSSDYNCRMRPAEVLVSADGSTKLIRRRETIDDIVRMMPLED